MRLHVNLAPFNFKMYKFKLSLSTYSLPDKYILMVN